MSDEQHICQTCRFAAWKTKPDGTILQSLPGRCRWRAILDVPFVIERAVAAQVDNVGQHGIWWKRQTECRAWEGITGRTERDADDEAIPSSPD